MDDSGYSFTLQGKEIASFSASDARTRDLQRTAMRTQRSRTGTGLLNIMSPEVYKSLLRIFHVEGTAVLSTYDPCGVVQAAAVTLGRHCLTFLGRSTKTSLQTIDIDDVPLLRARKAVRTRRLRRVVGDHKGNVLTEAGAARRETGSKRKGLTKKEDIDGKGSDRKGPRNAKILVEEEAGNDKGSGGGESCNGKESGTQDASRFGVKEARDEKESWTRRAGIRKDSGTKKAESLSKRRNGGTELKTPRKRPGSSFSPEKDRLTSSRKRPNVGDADSILVRTTPDCCSSETAP